MVSTVNISKATLAELGTALAVAGHADMLTEDGTIACGDIEFAADGLTVHAARASRFAQEINDAAAAPSGNVVYQDSQTEVSTRCRPDGVHVIEETNGAHREIVVPRSALPVLSADLVDCMARSAN